MARAQAGHRTCRTCSERSVCCCEPFGRGYDKKNVGKLDKTSSSISEWGTLLTSLPKAEEAADTLVDDAELPGRGLSPVFVVVGSLPPSRSRPTEGTINLTPGRNWQEIIRRLRLQYLTGYFRGLTKDALV